MERQDRRVSSRKGLERLTYIDMPGGNGGIVTDISEGGLGFHVVSPLGSLGPIHFLLSGNSTRIFGAGNVVWTDEKGKSGGLQFTELAEEIREQIRDWPFRTKLNLQTSDRERPHFEDVSRAEEVPAAGRENHREPDFSGLSLPEDRLGKRSRLLKMIGISGLAGMVGVLSYFSYRDAWLWPGGSKTGGSSEQFTKSPTPRADLNPSSEIALLQNAAERSDVGSETLPGALQASANDEQEASGASQTEQYPEAPGLQHAAGQSAEFLVQVAAVTQEADAYRVLDALRQKNFAAFISQSVNDGFYRVQLGPYQTRDAARASVQALEQAGYKPFIRR